MNYVIGLVCENREAKKLPPVWSVTVRKAGATICDRRLERAFPDWQQALWQVSEVVGDYLGKEET